MLFFFCCFKLWLSCMCFFFFSSRRRHTRLTCDWSSDVCSSDLGRMPDAGMGVARMVGHVTYLSALALGDKFGRRLQFADDIRYTITEPELEVESYLRHQ